MCVDSAAAIFGLYGAFMPENLTAFTADLNRTFALNGAFPDNNFSDKIPISPSLINNISSRIQPLVNPLSMITSSIAVTTGNITQRNRTKQHYSCY